MLLFVLIMGFYLIIEYRCYKTCITPFFVIGVIYLLAVPAVNIVGPLLGYYKIKGMTMALFLLYLTVLFLCDLSYKILLKKKEINCEKTEEKVFVKYQNIIWYLFCVMLIGHVLSLVQALQRYDLADIKGKAGGIFGHMGLFCVAISPIIVYLAVKTKNVKYIVGIAIMAVVLMLFGGKGYIMIPVIASCILLCFEKEIKPLDLVKIGAGLLGVAIVVFVIIYGVLPIIENDIWDFKAMTVVLKEALEHLFFYFASPFLASNTYFSKPMQDGVVEGMRVVFAPVVSLYEVSFGNQDYPNIIMDVWAKISKSAHRTQTNVGGLFSETVYHVGYVWTAIYVGAIGLYVSSCYYIKKRMRCFSATAALAISLLALCFFCNFFTLLSVIEIIVYLGLTEAGIMLLEIKKVNVDKWEIRRLWEKIKH